MALTLLEGRKNSEKVLKSGTLSTLQLSSLTKVLSGGSIQPAHHIKVVSGRGWYTASNACCILFLARVASRMRYCILPCLVENALNSRPLTPVSADPCDLNAITLNNFLLGEHSTVIPSVVGNNEFDHSKRYARAQSYANAIWSRWIKEYVPTLNRRSKWQAPAEQHLKTGDLVWIVEETNPRGYYPTARIVELRYGSDSVARSAVLRTSTGSLVRPLVKLVPVFPSSSSGPEDVTQ